MLTSIKEISQILNLSKSTIYNWIRKGYLDAHTPSGKIELKETQKNSDFIYNWFQKKIYEPIQPYVPRQIIDYNSWHKVFDEFSWLIKVIYSDKRTIKSKKFRIDILFQNYLIQHKISLSKIRNSFINQSNTKYKTIGNDLHRGWYNELSFLLPLKTSTLGLSFSDLTINEDISNKRFTFPSWKIIMAYYSIYFYIRSITLQKVDSIRLDQHMSPINSFKHNVLKPLENVLWKFPFDIIYTPEKKVFRKNIYLNNFDHLKYQYSSHPRPPYSSPKEIFENIYKTFSKRSRLNSKPHIYTIIDFLLEFRIWSNYQDINNLLSLQNSGYKGFIDQSLSLILFFIAGFSELCFIANFGQDKYYEHLQNFYDLFITNNYDLEKDFVNTGIYQRSIIFKMMGYVNGKITLIDYEDMNELSFLSR